MCVSPYAVCTVHIGFMLGFSFIYVIVNAYLRIFEIFNSQMCANLCQLLVQLSTSSFGSIQLTNVSQDQFIIDVTGTLKLLNVLSLQYEEPLCTSSEDCVTDGVQLATCTPLGKCSGYNARRNIQEFTEKFFAPLLTGDIPTKHEPKVAGVLTMLHENQKELAVIQGAFHGIQTDLGAVATPAPTSHVDNDQGVKGVCVACV